MQNTFQCILRAHYAIAAWTELSEQYNKPIKSSVNNHSSRSEDSLLFSNARRHIATLSEFPVRLRTII